MRKRRRKRKMLTPKTEEARRNKVWSQKRNWRRFQLKGVFSILNSMSHDPVITRTERIEIIRARTKIKYLISNWTNRNLESKELYKL